jgi:twinkle protein
MRIDEYLDNKEFEYEIKNRPSGDNYIMVCPFCKGGESGRKTFAINANSGLWNCKRKDDCNKSGTFFQLQEMLGDIPVKIDPYIKKSSDNIKKYNIPKIIKIPLSNNSIKYLMNKRCFSEEIIKKFDLFDGIKGEIRIPYYKNGIIVNAKSRLKYKKIMWQCANGEHVLFNRDNVKGSDLLIITEGEYDCMALTQYGIENVVSVPNGANDHKWIENEWNFLEKFSEIYINMDLDSAGQNVVKPIINRLGKWRCKSIKLPYKDANECLINRVSNKEILYCFENAEEFTPAEIKTAGFFCEEVIDIYRNPEKYKGISTGFSELDKIIRGWRGGELTVWTGQSGSGKSTILNQSCLHMASKGIKCCIASLELRPARYLKWAVEQALGKNDPNEREIIKTFEWMNEWLYIIDIEDNVYGSKIFELFEYTARKYGIDQFVIDSLMKIRLKGADTEMSQVEFVDDYRNFGKKFDAHCHLVAHPRKQESDKDKPDKTAVKGRGEITDTADNVITIWRNVDDDKEDLEEDENRIDGLLIVRKNREFGDLGSIQLFFDNISRRFMCKGQDTFLK